MNSFLDEEKKSEPRNSITPAIRAEVMRKTD